MPSVATPEDERAPPAGLARDGARASISAAFEELQPRLQALAIKLCGDPSDARDLVQDTFERALVNSHRFVPGSNPRAWLGTILRNLFIDRCRRKQRCSTVDLESDRIPSPVPERPPWWAALTREDHDRAVQQLPDPFRETYVLHVVEGLSYKEISAELGLSMNTVGTRIRRARLRLRDILREQAGRRESKP